MTDYHCQYTFGHFTIVTNGAAVRLEVDIDMTLEPSGTPIVIPRTKLSIEAHTPAADDLGITYAEIIDAARALAKDTIASNYPLYANWPGEGQTGHSSGTNTLATGTPYETVVLTF